MRRHLRRVLLGLALTVAGAAVAETTNWALALREHREASYRDAVAERERLRHAAEAAKAAGDWPAWAFAEGLRVSRLSDRADATVLTVTQALEQALAAQPSLAVPSAGSVIGALGAAGWYLGHDASRFRALLDRAARDAAALQDPELMAQVTFTRAVLHFAQGDAAAVQAQVHRTLELSRDPLMKHAVFTGPQHFARMLGLQGSEAVNRYLAEIDRHRAEFDAQALPYLAVAYAVMQGQVLIQDGRAREARRILTAALDAATRAPGFEVLPYVRRMQARLFSETGDWRGCMEAMSGLSRNDHGEGIRLQFELLTAECRARAGSPTPREDIATLERLLPVFRQEPPLVERALTAQAQAFAGLGDYRSAFEKLNAARSVTLERFAKANEQERQRVETVYRVAARDQENAELKAREALADQRRRVLWGALAVAVLVLVVVGELLRRQSVQRRQLAALADELRTLNASRTRLVAAACHDLRQPAHALGMLVEIASTKASPEQASQWEGIRRASASLSDLLDALFDLSRLESDRYLPSIGPVSLGELLGDLRSQFTVAALSKGLTLRIDDVQASVRSDAHLLRRMLMNLLSNAIKYTATGGVQVLVKRDGEDWAVSVQDTGPGIPAEQQAAAFSEYVRLDSSRDSDGLGIGLALVKRSADLLGHGLALASTVGQGSCFTLRLAAADDLGTLPDTAPAPHGAGQVIGVVDDDESIREALGELLRLRGYVALTAPSLELLQAQLDSARTPRPALVLSDFHLGARESLGPLAARVGPGGAWAGVPAVLITGDLGPEVLARCRAVGISVAYKPLPAHKLTQLVQRLLTDEAAHQPARETAAG